MKVGINLAEKKNVNFKLSDEERQKLYKIADDVGTTVSSLLRILIKQRIQSCEKDGWHPEKFIGKD